MTEAQHTRWFHQQYPNYNNYQSAVESQLIEMGSKFKLSTRELHAVLTGYQTELIARECAEEILNERMNGY